MKIFFHLQECLFLPNSLRLQKLFLVLFGIFLYPILNAQHVEDSLAIIKLLEKEGLTWRTGDKKEHAECWLERPYSRVMVSTANGRTIDVPVQTMIDPPQNMIGNGGFAFHSNHKIKIDDHVAWVSHDEVSVDTAGKESLSFEIRLLEKFKGEWKMVGQSIHSFDHPPENKIDTTSYIQTVDIETGRIETVLNINKHFEAPNWHPDNYLIVNSKGKLYTLHLETKELKLLDTGFADQCNNDHGFSPDHKWLAISHNDRTDPSTKPYKSAIYVLPIEGGTPKRVTSEVMSFWHGWSPDGKRLAYCAERNGNYDVYTIDVNGGKEKRLTTADGLDDGPEYSPDGKYIYYNSYKSGHMQIWRMLTNGKKQEQLTFDSNSNWFPHPSPDGKWIAYIAYTSDQKQEHLFGKQVKLRLMNVETKAIKDITPVFYGGQGTINVPSWSPDSKKVAFVSYSVN
ncbi:TolB family protein [Flagellimonas crocea]|uniref:TolB family protein n=1 Tax=Flagellimonas crocea TaxID=3067311 RepID=UPI00296EC4CD|nr:hypothetical protein [Muricauda sp. DH64]